MVKAQSCSLRKTHPIGPIKGCKEDCNSFVPCVEVSKVEIEQGLDEVKGPYQVKGKHDELVQDGESRYCFCGKKVSKAETNIWSFKGMFVCHLKAKHPGVYSALKNNEIEYEDIYYVK